MALLEPVATGAGSVEGLDVTELGPRGLEVLKSLDSRCFGFLGFQSVQLPCKVGERSHEATFVSKEFIRVGIKKLKNDLLMGPQSVVYQSEIMCQLGHLHLLLEEYTQALSSYQQYQTMCPGRSSSDVNYLYGLGLIYFHMNSYKWAIEMFQNVLQLCPSFARSSEVHLRLGVMFKKIGQYEMSAESFRKAHSIPGPSSFNKLEILFHIGHLYYLQGDYIAAKEVFEGILSSKAVPSTIKAMTLRQLGWLYHSIPEVANSTPDPNTKATELLTLAVSADPTVAQAWYFLGRCHAHQGHIYNAFVAYQSAISRSSEGQGDVWCSVGLLYHKMGQSKDSLQSYLCAVYLEPQNLSAWVNMGCVYEAVSQPMDALLAYKNAAMVIHQRGAAKIPTKTRDYVFSRLSNLEQQMDTLSSSTHSHHQLPSLYEAWNTLIPQNIRGKHPSTSTPILQLPTSFSHPPQVPANHSLPASNSHPQVPSFGSTPHITIAQGMRPFGPPSKRARYSKNKDPIILKNINEGWNRQGFPSLSSSPLIPTSHFGPPSVNPVAHNSVNNGHYGVEISQSMSLEKSHLPSSSQLIESSFRTANSTPRASTGMDNTGHTSDVVFNLRASTGMDNTRHPSDTLFNSCSQIGNWGSNSLSSHSIPLGNFVPGSSGGLPMSFHSPNPQQPLKPTPHHTGYSSDSQPSSFSPSSIPDSLPQHRKLEFKDKLSPTCILPNGSSSSVSSYPYIGGKVGSGPFLSVSSPERARYINRNDSSSSAGPPTGLGSSGVPPAGFPQSVSDSSLHAVNIRPVTSSFGNSFTTETYSSTAHNSYNKRIMSSPTNTTIPDDLSSVNPLKMSVEMQQVNDYLDQYLSMNHSQEPLEVRAEIKQSSDVLGTLLTNRNAGLQEDSSETALPGSSQEQGSAGSVTNEEPAPRSISSPNSVFNEELQTPQSMFSPNSVDNEEFQSPRSQELQTPNEEPPPNEEDPLPLEEDSCVSFNSAKPSTSASSGVSSPKEGETLPVVTHPVETLCSPVTNSNGDFVYPNTPLLLSPSSSGNSDKLLDPINEPFPFLDSNVGYMIQSPKFSPPDVPAAKEGVDLHPKVDIYQVQDKQDAYSEKLHKFCCDPNRPVCIIQGICSVLDLNINLFSSESLVQSNPHHRMEVREQIKQDADENSDSSGHKQVWKCESSRSFTTIQEYATYQKRISLGQDESTTHSECSDSQHSDSTNAHQKLKSNGRHHKMIRFGTNVDLSDQCKWSKQLEELNKLPKFFRVACPEADFLSHIGHTILGMNSVQLYMKVPGARTPGHQENNNFCSINVNIGPGDCEWFAVHNQYWGMFNQLCEKNKLCFLTGSWWPILSELQELNIPVYRFTQYMGDVVWLNPGTVHWVQANSVCNNIAWNIGPLTAHQFRMSWERYQWNKVQKVRSIVPMVHMTWNLVRRVKIAHKTLYLQLKSLLKSSVEQSTKLLEHLSNAHIPVHWQGREEGEPAPCCYNCHDEVFNILFVLSHRGEYLVYCHKCASDMKKAVVVLQQYKIDELNEVLESFKLYSPTSSSSHSSSVSHTSTISES